MSAFTPLRRTVVLSNKYSRLLRSFYKLSHSRATSLNLLKLKDRGLFENIFPNTRISELQKLLEKPQALYCGFDPTADSLHIGNLLSILALIRAQRAGHSPIAVIGGATGFIGDPSGKTKDRVAMREEDIESNVAALMANVQYMVNNHQEHFNPAGTELPEFRVLNNRDWYKETNVISFLSSVGRHFRVGEMMSRHSVQSRLHSKEGISCTEFMYQVFQGADWLHLYQKYGCSIQVGGNDQLGNISSGFDLIHKVTNQYVFGLLVPLLLSPSGQKLGKSSGNSLWLNSDRTSPYEFYQFFINLPDAEVEKYLKLFTFYTSDEIQAIVAEHMNAPEKRLGQQRIADSVTTLVHGVRGLVSAQKCTDIFFHNSVTALQSLQSLDEGEMATLFKSIPMADVLLNSSLTVVQLAKLLKCFKTDADADRIIKAGGFYLNQQRVTDPTHSLRDGQHVLSNNLTLVRVGKKSYHLVRWKV